MANEAAAMLVENERRRLKRIMDDRRQDIRATDQEREELAAHVRQHNEELNRCMVKYAELTGSLVALGIDPDALAQVEGYASDQGVGLSEEARKACIAEYQPAGTP